MGNKAILYLLLVILSLPMILRNPINGLFVFVAMNYIRPETLSYHELAPFHLPMVVAVITLVAFLVHAKSRLKFSGYQNIIFFLFVLTQLHSTLYAPGPDLSFYYNTVMMKIWIFTFLMTRMIDTVKKFNWFLIINLIGISFLSVWGFEQHFRGNIRLEEVGGGNFTDSNTLAAAIVQFMPILAALSFKKTGKHKIILMIISLIMVAAVVFTESRAAYLGIIIAGLILLLRFKKSFQLIAVSSLLLGTFYFAAINTEGYLDRTSLDSMQREKWSDRVHLWEAAWEVAKIRPLTGIGQQNFSFFSKDVIEQKIGAQAYFDYRGDAHNTFLLILAEGGFISFFFFLLMICLFFKDLWAVRKMLKSNTEFFYLLSGMEAGMVAFLFTNWFHSMSIMENLYWFLFLPAILKSIILHQKYDDNKIRELQFNLKYNG